MARVKRKKLTSQYLPSGLTETQVVSIIDSVAILLAPKFLFRPFDIEDLRQQGRWEAWKVIDKFDPSKKSMPMSTEEALKRFLLNHVRKRLFNFKRDNLGRFLEKKKVRFAVDIEKVDENNEAAVQEQTSVNNLAYESELKEIIDGNLDVSLRVDYNKMLAGVPIPGPRKTKVKQAIVAILISKGIMDEDGQIKF